MQGEARCATHASNLHHDMIQAGRVSDEISQAPLEESEVMTTSREQVLAVASEGNASHMRRMTVVRDVFHSLLRRWVAVDCRMERKQQESNQRNTNKTSSKYRRMVALLLFCSQRSFDDRCPAWPSSVCD